MRHFWFNNDLDSIEASFHNICHSVITFVFAWLLVLLFKVDGISSGNISYYSMMLYEVWDGYKRDYRNFYFDYSLLPVKLFSKRWWIQNFLYSNGFSAQDILVWNFIGYTFFLLIYNIVNLFGIL